MILLNEQLKEAQQGLYERGKTIDEQRRPLLLVSGRLRRGGTVDARRTDDELGGRLERRRDARGCLKER